MPLQNSKTRERPRNPGIVDNVLQSLPPLDPYLVSLLHFNGADASVIFTDEKSKIWTPSGNAQINTAQSVFGGASGVFDGTGDYIITQNHADFAFGSGDLTIDTRIRLATLPAVSGISTIFAHITDTSNFHLFFLYNNAGVYEWRWQVSSGGVTIISVIKTATVAINTWYHLACVRSVNDWKIFQNGTQVGTTVSDADAIPTFTTPVSVGSYNSASYFHGWMDELRISKGPPVSEYTVYA